MVFYIGQAKAPFIAMLVLGGMSAAIEAHCSGSSGASSIFSATFAGDGWSGLLAAHGAELFGMLVLIGIIRFVVRC
jgi:ATP-binding cassette subfamily B multidrug efflux pump